MKNKKKQRCCNEKHRKVSFKILNSFLLIIGFGVVSLGIWTLIEKHSYVNLLVTSIYAASVYILIASGIFLITICILGFVAIHKNKQELFHLYFWLLLSTFLLEAAVCILGVIYQHRLHDELTTSLNSTFMQNYGKDEEKTRSIDDMQRSFHCCGANSFEDWGHSLWKIEGNSSNLVPESCCKTESPLCAIRDHPSNIYYTGCVHSFEEYLKNHLFILNLTALIICFVQICAVICSGLFCMWPKKRQYSQVHETNFK